MIKEPSPSSEQTKTSLQEAQDAIMNSSTKIEEEFARTSNSWMACFGTRVFIIETYLSSKEVKNEVGIAKYTAIIKRLEDLKQRLYELKEQYPSQDTVPPNNIKQELLEMLDVLK
ncbi:MAG: hypothetical protein WC310_00165 [Patescibacteria group bacterium]|jgi:hypothetical protein